MRHPFRSRRARPIQLIQSAFKLTALIGVLIPLSLALAATGPVSTVSESGGGSSGTNADCLGIPNGPNVWDGQVPPQCCPSTEIDDCGVCNGHSTCSNLNRACSYHAVNTVGRDSEESEGQDIFSGSSRSLECLNAILAACESDGTQQLGQSDDCVWRYFHDLQDFRQFLEDHGSPTELGENFSNWHEINFMDSECRPVDPTLVDHTRICGDLTVTRIRTPISLLWDRASEISEIETLAEFALDPKYKNGCSTWKASVRAPLLVYDPDHTGQVSSPEQLFGNFTFGGKRKSLFVPSSLSGSSGVVEQWSSGYEALATLDQNGDRKLMDAELDALALWFDVNRDGRSQANEVQALKQLGVYTIYVTPDRVEHRSGDIYATVGYERIVAGEMISGSSVDWMARTYPSKAAAIQAEQLRRALDSKPSITKETRTGDNTTATTKSRLGTSSRLSGPWYWKISGHEHDPSSPHGVFILKEQSGRIGGHAYTEVPLNSAPGAAPNLKSMVLSFPIEGQSQPDNLGRMQIKFTVKDSGGMVTRSVALLSADGSRLEGSSQTEGSKSHFPDIDYYWVATRKP